MLAPDIPEHLRDPQPQLRPALALWLWERGISDVEAAEVLKCHPASVRRYCKPFGHAERRVPDPDVMMRIGEWTRGEITLAHFYPPRLTGPSPEPANEALPEAAE